MRLVHILKLIEILAFPLLVFFCLSGCSSMLYYPSPHAYTDPAQFRHKPELIDFKSDDGLRLHGWYFKSPVRPAKATILFFHGNAQNLSTHFFSLYWLLEHGYDYFIFDYRGFGNSEGKPSPEGTLKDGKAALKWVNENKDPSSKTVIFAQSLGSAVALRVACDATEENGSVGFESVIVDSGFVSYRRVAQKALSRSWILWPFQWLAHVVLSDEYAPKDCVSKISPRPLLVVHGDSDQTVDFSHGEKLFNLSREPKEFWKIEGGRHTDFVFRENFRYRPLFLDWVERSLIPLKR